MYRLACVTNRLALANVTIQKDTTEIAMSLLHVKGEECEGVEEEEEEEEEGKNDNDRGGTDDLFLLEADLGPDSRPPSLLTDDVEVTLLR
jgi:hypothetical protein